MKERWNESLYQAQAPVAGELSKIRERINEILVSSFAPIDDVISHLFSTPGKMMRPTLLLLAADREEARREDLISIGAAVEIVHTASLVHDDSIDNSGYRRGIETLNSKWNHKTSVIIGDYLLARAFTEIAKLEDLEIMAEITAACNKLAIGEIRQMSMEGDLDVSEEDYFLFIREKTASLFAATCSVAAILSGNKAREELSRFGMLFGCIFQITDDLLDYVGLSPVTGKPTGLDIRDRKMTLPLIYALKNMNRSALLEIEEAFNSETRMSREIGSRLTELVISAGGVDYAWARMIELAAEARVVLDGVSGQSREKLRVLVDMIIERDR